MCANNDFLMVNLRMRVGVCMCVGVHVGGCFLNEIYIYLKLSVIYISKTSVNVLTNKTFEENPHKKYL